MITGELIVTADTTGEQADAGRLPERDCRTTLLAADRAGE
jgi:hypothetical protein